MATLHEDPPVSLEDITQIQRRLFRRWWPAFASVGVKMLGIWLAGSLAVYFVALYLGREWTFAPTHTVAVVSMGAVTLLPYLLWVVQGLWLDYRLSRRLDEMARQLRAGEVVRASRVRL